MNNQKIIPFYQAFSIPGYQMAGYMPFLMAQEDTSEQDLEYLQQIFPEASRRYARKISDVVDRLDYPGSMIYDEFPDRLRLQRLSNDILRMINEEEALRQDAEQSDVPDSADNKNTAALTGQCRAELVYVLLCYEIYKRRHTNGTDMSRFYRP